MSIFNISTSPTNPIRVSPPTSSAIEVATTQQLSKTTISSGSRIGSYQNRSTYINHDALLLRSQLLSKNMREGHFNFYTAKSDPYSLSYVTSYLTSQKISTIFYTNYFNLPSQSDELSYLLSQYNPVSQDLTKQYSFVVTDEYLETGNSETLLNAIANEYATNYDGIILDTLIYINSFTIDFPKNKLLNALNFASTDPRILNSLQNGYISLMNWTGTVPRSKSNSSTTVPKYPTDCYENNNVENEWPNFICTWNKTANRSRTKQEIIEFNNLKECYSDPTVKNPTTSAFWHLDRLDDPALPLDRCYSGRTKPLNKNCLTIKTVELYVCDVPIDGKPVNCPEFEGRLYRFMGPVLNGPKMVNGSWDHGVKVASLAAGRRCGVTRKPLITGVGVITSNRGGTYLMIAKGINDVIKDRKNQPNKKMVMNLSLGGLIPPNSPPNLMEIALQKAMDLDIIVIVAAGNSNIDASLFTPARMADAITVGATWIAGKFLRTRPTMGLSFRQLSFGDPGWRGHYLDTKAPFSNYGSAVDIWAPGVWMTCADWIGRWVERSYSPIGAVPFSGTSFASPLVAGVAAEILRNIGKITQKQMKEIIIGYAAGGNGGVLGKWDWKDAYGIIDLVPGRDNNKLLQNPFNDCISTEEINDTNDIDDCADNPDIAPALMILQQPAINVLTNKASIDAKLLHGTISNQKYLRIPDIGIAWQAKAPTSSIFNTVGYGQEIDISTLENRTLLRVLLSFPSITGDDWNSNENSIVSNIIIFDNIEPSPSPSSSPNPSELYECQSCYPEPNCNGYNIIRMNWSGSFCNQGDLSPNGLINSPLDLVFQYNSWVFSSPTSYGSIYCNNGQWKFEYYNSSIDGVWSVNGTLGNVNPNDPCNVIGLNGTGTITYNVMTGLEEYCTGESPINLSIENFPCE